jgi:hypothetical protein
MSAAIGETEHVEIERRATLAFAVAPTPWTSFLETRHGGIGGENFMRIGNDRVLDHELYIRLYLASEQLVSPDVRLDAVIDFIANAADDIPRLIAEVRGLRTS